jgi:AAA15 family ATPase/GTPase
MLQSLEIQNFTVFEEAKLEFSAGLNIIIGENGTGKTHLLKLGYVLLKSLSKDQKSIEYLVVGLKSRLAQEMVEVYRPDNLGHLVTNKANVERCDVRMGIYPKSTKLIFSFNKKSQNE